MRITKSLFLGFFLFLASVSITQAADLRDIQFQECSIVYSCPVPTATITKSDNGLLEGQTWRNTKIEIYDKVGFWIADANIQYEEKGDIVSWSLDLNKLTTSEKHDIYFITYNLSKRDRSKRSETYTIPVNKNISPAKNTVSQKTTTISKSNIIAEVSQNNVESPIAKSPFTSEQKIEERKKEVNVQNSENKDTEKKNVPNLANSGELKVQAETEILNNDTEEKTEATEDKESNKIIGYALLGIVFILIIVALLSKDDENTPNPLLQKIKSLFCRKEKNLSENEVSDKEKTEDKA